jgi:hypothetical protein
MLSESVLSQILLKADDIQTDGDQELRKRRKGLVEDANAILRSLDRKMGKKK